MPARLALVTTDVPELLAHEDAHRFAVDVTGGAADPNGNQTLAQITSTLDLGLRALGGDQPPPGGGPGCAARRPSRRCR